MSGDNHAKQITMNGAVNRSFDQRKSRMKMGGSRFGVLNDVVKLETCEEGHEMGAAV